MSKQNGVFRKKKVYFTQVSNTALRDKVLSLQAKGLYAIIQSYITIENFTLYKNHLRIESGLSENTFDKYWKELKDRGYLIQYKYYDSGSKGAKYEYELLDIPTEETVEEVVKEDTEEEFFTPQKLRSKNLRSKNLRPKKLGVYNNTDSSNTESNNTYDTTHSVSSSENIDYIETYTHLKLSNNMRKEVLKWDMIRLEVAVVIFNAEGGKYFSLLKKIYNDDGNFAKKKQPKVRPFNDFPQREYDYDSLERKLLGWD